MSLNETANATIKQGAYLYDKAALKNRFDMLRDNWSDQLVSFLKSRFTPEVYDRLGVIATTEVNLLKKVADESAQVYRKPAKRSCQVGENEDPTFADIVEDAQLDTCMKTANWLTRGLNHVLIGCLARDGHVEIDIYTPDRFDIICDPTDWKRIAGIAIDVGQSKEMPGEAERTVILRDVWARLGFAYTPPGGKPVVLEAGNVYRFRGTRLESSQPIPYFEESEEANEANVLVKVKRPILPFVLTYKNFPIDSLVSYTEDSSLVESTLLVNALLTLLNEIHKFQSFKQPYVVGPTGMTLPKDMVAAAWSILTVGVPAGQTANIGTLDLETDPTKILDAIQNRVHFILAQYGIPPSSFIATAAPSSGWSKQQDRMSLMEIRENDVGFWRLFERRLFEIIRVVNNTHSKNKIPLEAEFEIDFAEPDIDETVQEMVARETHELANHLTASWRLLQKRNPDLSEEEAKKEVEENRLDAEGASAPTGLAAAFSAPPSPLPQGGTQPPEPAPIE